MGDNGNEEAGVGAFSDMHDSSVVSGEHCTCRGVSNYVVNSKSKMKYIFLTMFQL